MAPGWVPRDLASWQAGKVGSPILARQLHRLFRLSRLHAHGRMVEGTIQPWIPPFMPVRPDSG